MIFHEIINKLKFYFIDHKYSFYLDLVIIYIVFGVIWILLSNYIIFNVIDLPHYLSIENIRGLIFVFLSALIIFFSAKVLSTKYNFERKSRGRLAFIMDQLNYVICMTDMEGNIQYCNNETLNRYNADNKGIIGNKISNLIKTSDIKLKEIYDSIKSAGEWRGELSPTEKYKRQAVFESNWHLVLEEDGTQSVLVILNDVSDKKQLEKQFYRAQRMESLGALSGGIAHDLNNVLQPILLSLNILREAPDSKKQNLIDIIEESTERGANLVKQVLLFSRGHEGEFSIIELSGFLKEFVNILRSTLPKSIQITTEISPDINQIVGDVTNINQVLMNLCINAKDAMPGGGLLTISVSNIEIDEDYTKLNINAKVGEYVVLTVSDNGIGITKENIDKIFEPFFTTKGIGVGTGLGLSTVYSIVKSHGGFVNVYSEVGKGTTFRVYIPNAEKTQHKIKRTSESEIIPQGQGETILLVDDEPGILNIAKLNLEHNGYKVVTANDGLDAIEKYNQFKNIDLVFMDLMMPNMDGINAARTLKSINPNQKIILTSGFQQRKELSSLLSEIEINAILSKPYNSKTLLKTVRNVLTH